MGNGKENRKGTGRRAWSLLALAAALALSACAGGGRPAHPAPAGDRLELLTSFTLALSKRDFEAASSLLVEEDRGRLRGGDGKVREEMKERLRAMRKSTLVRNPMVTVEGGRLRGIYDLIPVLDQDTSAALAATAAPDTDTVPVSEAPIAAAEASDAARASAQAALRELSGRFFRSVRARDWKRALAMLDPGEREVFLRGDGRLKEEARSRLLAIDTASWQALTVEDGKLAGVVLIIPARAAGEGDAGETRTW